MATQSFVYDGEVSGLFSTRIIGLNKFFPTTNSFNWDSVKEITKISLSFYAACNPGPGAYSTRYYFKVALVDENNSNISMSSSKISKEFAPSYAVPKIITQHFKGVNSDGETSWTFKDNTSSFSLAIPSVDAFKNLIGTGGTEKGKFLIYANDSGHDYLGKYSNSSDYGVIVYSGEDYPITLTLDYEEVSNNPDIKVENLTLSNNGGYLIANYNASYNNNYSFQSSDYVSSVLKRDNEIVFSKELLQSELNSFFNNTAIDFNEGITYEENSVYEFIITTNINNQTLTYSTSLLSNGTAPRRGKNFVLSGEGNGVSMGGDPTGTAANPMFDCYHLANFHKGILIGGEPLILPKFLSGIADLAVSGGSGSLTINFENPFSNPPVVTATLYRSGGADRQPSLVLTSITASSFSLSCYQDNTGNTNYKVHWIVIGT